MSSRDDVLERLERLKRAAERVRSARRSAVVFQDSESVKELSRALAEFHRAKQELRHDGD